MARKPRVLTKLRIDEVSSVDRGAGEGVKIVLMKRHDPSPRDRFDVFRTIDFAKIKTPVDYGTEGSDDQTTTKLPGRLEQFIAALQTANPNLSREDAVRYLVHGVNGRATARHMSETFKQGDTTTMIDRAEGLRQIAKDHGLQAIAKLIVTGNDAQGITEAELTSLGLEECKKHALPGERSATTFARWYAEDEQLEFRKAIQLAKSYPQLMDMKPTQVGGAAATNSDADKSKAYDQLVAMAEEMRAKSPTLTVAQCFARVFAATENAQLAARAAQRPTATSR